MVGVWLAIWGVDGCIWGVAGTGVADGFGGWLLELICEGGLDGPAGKAETFGGEDAPEDLLITVGIVREIGGFPGC